MRNFRKDVDSEAFERILAEGLNRCDVELYCHVLMPNHWHLVPRPNRDGEMGEFLRWITVAHTMRYHAHYHTAGQGHVYQGGFKSFPIQDDGHFLTVDKANATMREAELEAVRRSTERGSPLGDEIWTVATAQRLGITSTLRRAADRECDRSPIQSKSPDPFDLYEQLCNGRVPTRRD